MAWMIVEVSDHDPFSRDARTLRIFASFLKSSKMTKVEKSDLYRQLFILQSAGKIAPDAQEVAQAMWQLHQKEVIPKLTLVHSQATCFLREAS